jgi:hypothetical protein
MRHCTRLLFAALITGLILGGIWSERRVSAGGTTTTTGTSRPVQPLIREKRLTAGPGQESRGPRPRITSLVRNHATIQADTALLNSQARKSGHLSLVIANRPMEIDLQLNDLRAPNYIAEEIQADGSRRQLTSGPVRTWRGTVAGMPKAEARFTLDENTLEGIIFDDDDWYIVEPLSRYDESAGPGDFVTYRRTDLIEQSMGTCGTTLAQEIQTQAARLGQNAKKPDPTPQPQIQWRIELATDADSDFVTALGNSDNANAEIQTIINQVDGIYQQQLLLSFTIVRQVTRTTPGPYTSTNPSTLLAAVKDEWNANFTGQARDLVHMFTGKDLDGTTIGIAYTGVICSVPTFSYGLSQRFNQTPQKFVLTAHEMGHNFSAQHPDQVSPPVTECVGTIMNSSVTPGQTFCNFSKGEISGFIAIPANSACLTQVQNTCSFSASPTSGNFQIGGGNGSTTVTTGTGCNWTAFSQVSWITINTPTGQTSGNGTVSFTVASNSGGFARTGTFVAAGQVVTINQAGTQTCPTTQINFKQTLNGDLATNDCPMTRTTSCGAGTRTFDQYQFSGVAGQQVAISLTAANPTALDTYLFLIGPTGSVVAENDDIVLNTNTNSRIPATGFLTLPATGTYTIEATSCNPNAVGSYTISAQRQKNPTTPGQYRPSNGFVYIRNTNDTGIANSEFFYGIASDIPISGDWNGDGVDTVGIYRNGQFFLRNSNDTGNADINFAFGAPGDLPIAGDWDGDGIDTIGLVRGNLIFLRNSNSTGAPDISFAYGSASDLYIAGDWNGDGIDTIGCFRPTNGFVYLRNSNTTGVADIEFFYGIAGDKPVAGDWNADGIDTIGIVRSNGWFLRNTNTTGFADLQFTYGTPTDVPIVGDWNGIQ